jgi:hypothetical protein
VSCLHFVESVVGAKAAAFWLVRSISAWCEHKARLRRNQFGNADQIVGDQIEQEVGVDGADATMLRLAHRAVLLGPAENAFDHRAARLSVSLRVVPAIR